MENAARLAALFGCIEDNAPKPLAEVAQAIITLLDALTLLGAEEQGAAVVALLASNILSAIAERKARCLRDAPEQMAAFGAALARLPQR